MKKFVKWFVGPWAVACAVYVTVTSWQAFAAGSTPPIASWYLGKGTTYGPKAAPFVDSAGRVAGEVIDTGGQSVQGFSTSGLNSTTQLLVILLLVVLLVVVLSGRKGSKGKSGKGSR